jgi:hypothetical protein
MEELLKKDAFDAVAGRNARSRTLKVLIGAFAILLLGATSVFALQTHQHKGDASTGSVPGGTCCFAGAAVDQGSGDVYAVDQNDPNTFAFGLVHRFNADGSYDATFKVGESLAGPQDVAIDESGTASDGNVYVADSGHNQVVALDSSGALISAFGDSEPATDGRLAGTDTPLGSFSNPCGVAVDQSNGNLFVSDYGHNRIWIFDSTGAYKGTIAESSLNGPCGLAFTSSGDLYVRNANDGGVLRFNRVGALDYEFASILYGGTEGGATDVAVDTSGDHVYVDRGDRVVEYDAAGSQVSIFGQGTLGNSTGVAVNSGSDTVYATDGGGIRIFGPLVTLPDVVTGGTSNVTATSATVEGTIDAAGGPNAQCEFEYGTSTAYGQTAPCEPAGPFAAGAGQQAVHANLSGLDPATSYHYTLRGSSSEGDVAGSDQTFTTWGPPVIDSLWAMEVTTTSARLEARVNPRGATTTYRFEYTTLAGFQANGFAGATSVPAPDGVVGSDDALHLISEPIAGLSPGARYVFRIVVSNAVESRPSEPKTFQAMAAPVAGLPEGRAYELVSPANKGGNDVYGNLWQTAVAPDGNAVTYSSPGAFADSRQNSISNSYIAERGSEGWTTHALTPYQGPPPAWLPEYGAFGKTLMYSRDLTRSIVAARHPLTYAPNVAGLYKLYRRNNLRAGVAPNPADGASYSLLNDSVQPFSEFEDFSSITDRQSLELADATPDLGKVLFMSRRNLTQDTIDAGLDEEFAPKVYEWDEGVLRLAGVLPNGEPAPASVAGGNASWLGNVGGPCGGYTTYMSSTISEDGSRVFFTGAPFDSPCGINGGWLSRLGGSLYMRVDHSQTIKLNESERTDCAGDPTCGGDGAPDPSPDPNATGVGTFGWATPDGHKVFFVTADALVDEDVDLREGVIATGRIALDVYMYDVDAPAGQHLTLISKDAEPAFNEVGDGESVIGTSRDGRYVYFKSEDPLLPNTPTAFGEWNLYVWHDGEIRLVGGFEAGGFLNTLTDERMNAQMRITPDGKHMLFSSYTALNSQLAGVDVTSRNAGPGEGCGTQGFDEAVCEVEVYLYSYDSQSLKCVSCPPTGARPRYGAEVQSHVFGQINATNSGGETQNLTKPISDDGRLVFFNTREKLVATDTNDRLDAYVYDVLTGEHRLLSTGQCNCESGFVSLSPDGRDAFFVTSQRLVGIDTDTSRDLYDARIGGGIAAQNPVLPLSCEGDACQPVPVPPNDATPGSSSYSGAGNVKRPKAKHRKKHKKHRHKRKAHKKGQKKQGKHRNKQVQRGQGGGR